MKNIKAKFNEHFRYIEGIEEEIKDYIIGTCDAESYAFTPFDGWEEVLTENFGIEEICMWFVEGILPENGKTHYAFTDRQSNIVIVDPDYLKKHIVEHIDSWRK